MKRNGFYLILIFAIQFTNSLAFRNFGEKSQLKNSEVPGARQIQEDIAQLLMSNIHSDNIISYLRQLTKKPHRAGTEENHQVGEFIRQEWTRQGLQNVHFAEYDALLSHPADYEKPNTIELLDDKGKLIFKSIGQMPTIIPDEQSDYGANVTFNAYSASGTAIGNLIYVNYGTRTDFEYLDSRNISLAGKIALIRYGSIYRGDKVSNAQKRGAIGVILFSDPADVCSNVTDEAKYPNSIWMPQGGVQLGTLMNTNGDPLTPLYPAVDYTYRSKNISDIKNEGIIPSIPVQPISYADAYEFLSRMKGETAPQNWQGGLNISYKIDQGSENWQARLTVNVNNARGKIKNVIGYIEGSKEPDRYVIIGNHYDAWIYGAVDPNSATAVMLEISRSFMQVSNETGWRPLRTIIFCAWDSEEYGVIGANEWVEENALILDHRAIAYLNIDDISGNDTLDVSATPTLYQVAVDAAKRVPNPNSDEAAAGRKTLYDTWVDRLPGGRIQGFPEISEPSGGSDQIPFFQYLGLPIIDFDYTNLTTWGYPLYHTLYETKFLQENLMDTRNFSVHVAVGQFWAEMTRVLADSEILTINIDHYAIVLQQYVEELNETLISSGILPTMENVAEDMQSLKAAVDRLGQHTEKFQANANQCKNKNCPNKENARLDSEMINSRLQQIERCFINPRGGDSNSPEKRHVIYSTSNDDDYASSVLPFIYAQIEEYKKLKNDFERDNAINNLRQQISIFHYSVECAISLLQKIP